MANLPKGITQRPDGRYSIRVMRDGQKVQKYAKTRKEAETILREITYELEHGTYRKDTKLTFDKWFDTWVETYKRPTIKASTISIYQCYYNVHVKPAIGTMRIQSVRASHIQKILNGMQAEYSDIEKKQQLFTDRIQDAEQVLNSFLTLQLCTGLRFGECAALQWQDIDLKNKVLHVRHTVHVVDGADVLTTPKTRCSLRDVPLMPKAIEVLRREKARAAGQKVIALDRFIFDGGNGRAVILRTLNRYMKRICKQIRQEGNEFPDLTSHDLRHTFATRAAESGMPPQTLKAILGHSSLAMTMDLYSHVLRDQKQAGIELIASAF